MNELSFGNGQDNVLRIAQPSSPVVPLSLYSDQGVICAITHEGHLVDGEGNPLSMKVAAERLEELDSAYYIHLAFAKLFRRIMEGDQP